MSATRSAAALTSREMLRLSRQPTRLLTALALPLIVWVLAGAGLADSFSDPRGDANSSISYAAAILPGIITAVIVFGTIVASMSLIQDRQAGFLQAVLVSPCPSWAIVAGKIAGGGAVTAIQAGVLVFAAPLVGLKPSAGGYAMAFVSIGLTTSAVIALGLALAWWINSTAGFHGVMNGVLMPMWLLSGAMFPVDGATPWLATVVKLNPLHWSTQTLGASLGLGEAGMLHWAGSAAFALVCCGAAALTIGRGRSIPGASAGE